MSFVKGMFGKKARGKEDFIDGGGSPGMNGSPGRARRSPAGGSTTGGAAAATTKSRDSSSPKRSPRKSHQQSSQSNGQDRDDPTQEEIDAMNLPFKQKSSKRDNNLSISRSGRHKYKNKQRMSVLTHDIYSDIPADQKKDSPSSGASGGGGVSKSGYRGVEAHSRQFQSHQRPTLSISGASAAV